MNQEQFGKFICEQRKGKQMTQKELGDKLGLTDKAISKWERGQTLPDITMIEKIAEVLEVSPLEIMQGKHLEDEKLTKQEAEEVLHDTVIEADRQGKRKQKRTIVLLLGGIILIMCILFSSKRILNHLLDIWSEKNESLAHISRIVPIYENIDEDAFYIYQEQLGEYLWNYHVASVDGNGESRDLFVLQEEGMELDHSPKLIKSNEKLYVLFDGLDNEDPIERIYGDKIGTDPQGFIPCLYCYDLKTKQLEKIEIKNETETLLVDAFFYEGETVYLSQKFKGVLGGLHLGFYKGGNAYISGENGTEFTNLFGDGGLNSTGSLVDDIYYILGQKGIYGYSLQSKDGSYVRQEDYSKCYRSEIRQVTVGGTLYYVLVAAYYDTWNDFHEPLAMHSEVILYNEEWEEIDKMVIETGVSGLEWGNSSLIITGKNDGGYHSYYVGLEDLSYREITNVTLKCFTNTLHLDAWEITKNQWVYLPEKQGYYYMDDQKIFIEE